MQQCITSPYLGMRMIATGMSLTGKGLSECIINSRKKSSMFVEENGYSASFHSGVNNWLAFWFCLVTSSYFLLSKKVDFFRTSSVKSEENVDFSNRRITNEITDNVNDALSYSESLESPHSTCSSTYYDVYSDISDLDRTNYWHSLLCLEEEDSEWLSDSMISENPSSPLSVNCDSFTEISDVDTHSYWDSLLRLEEEDSEWILDKESYWHSLLSLEEEDSVWLSDSMLSENPSTPLSCKFDSFTETSDIGTPSYWDSLLKLDEHDNEWISDKTSYWHSLLSLEEEDSDWLSDSIISESPSSPLSSNWDSYTDISDIGTPSYWDSLLKLDEQVTEVGSPISSFKINWGTKVLPSVSTTSSFTEAHCGKSEDVFSVEHLTETEDFNGDEPLFWPFEGEFNWDSEESSFCTSPRKRLVFDSGSSTSMINGSETSTLSTWSKRLSFDDDFDSNMNIPLEYFALDQEFAIEAFVGLKEFDGHEVLDYYEFSGDGFMLEESLQ